MEINKKLGLPIRKTLNCVGMRDDEIIEKFKKLQIEIGSTVYVSREFFCELLSRYSLQYDYRKPLFYHLMALLKIKIKLDEKLVLDQIRIEK